MNGDDPRFARIPARLLEELEAGEITFAGFALRVYLIGRTNHHTGRHVTTLAALRDLLAWPWSDQKLRNELRDLEPDFHVERGQGRNRWTFHVLADDFGLDPAELQSDFTPETPSDFEVTSNGEGPAEAAIAAAMPARGASELQTGASPQPSTDETSLEPGVAQAEPGSSRARDEKAVQTPADAAADEVGRRPEGRRLHGRERPTDRRCHKCRSSRMTVYYDQDESGIEGGAYFCDRHAPLYPCAECGKDSRVDENELCRSCAQKLERADAKLEPWR